MGHALVVGGTGMLSDVTVWLAKQGYSVSVIGRNKHRMDKTIKRCPYSVIHPILLDYSNLDELDSKLRDAVTYFKDIELVVAWVHSYADEALAKLLAIISEITRDYRLFHVLGSSADLQQWRSKLTDHPKYKYHQIQLGFIINNEKSRWLTNAEIASGVIEAITKQESVHIIGVTEPMNRRP